LLQVASSPSAAPGEATGGRYEIHELLRQYAQEKLDQTSDGGAAARDRHCAYYAAAMERWAADAKRPWHSALVYMRIDGANARAAWDWAVQREQVKRLDQMVDVLGWNYTFQAHHGEGEVMCRAAADRLRQLASGIERGTANGTAHLVAVSEAEILRTLAKILIWHSWFSWNCGREELAGQLLRNSMALLAQPVLINHDTRREKASVLNKMGRIAMGGDDLLEARRLYEQSLVLYEALEDRWMIAFAKGILGTAFFRPVSVWKLSLVAAQPEC
jgi:hypothetical protein